MAEFTEQDLAEFKSIRDENIRSGKRIPPIDVYVSCVVDYFEGIIDALVQRAETAEGERDKLDGKIEDAIRILDSDEPEYHDQGMGCGLEDRGITERYEAMAHGWEKAMERVYSENIAWAKDALATKVVVSTTDVDHNGNHIETEVWMVKDVPEGQVWTPVEGESLAFNVGNARLSDHRKTLELIIALQDGYQGEDRGRMRGYHVAGNMARQALGMDEKEWVEPFGDPISLEHEQPIEYRNDEAGFVEFINEDRPYIVRDLSSPCAILTDMETRKVIGYRVYDPSSQPPENHSAIAAERQRCADVVRNYKGTDALLVDRREIYTAILSDFSDAPPQTRVVEEEPILLEIPEGVKVAPGYGIKGEPELARYHISPDFKATAETPMVYYVVPLVKPYRGNRFGPYRSIEFAAEASWDIRASMLVATPVSPRPDKLFVMGKHGDADKEKP